MLKAKGRDLIGFLGPENDSPGFYLIAAESDIYQDHSKTIVKSILTYHEDSSKYSLHVVDFDPCKLNPIPSNVVLYDYFSQPFLSLEKFYEQFQHNYNPRLRNILVISNLNILNCYACNSSQLLTLLYKSLRKYTFKIYAIINASVAFSKELNEVYDLADSIALIMERKSSQTCYCCYLLKNRPDTKCSLNKIFFQIENEAIRQLEEDNTNKQSATSVTDEDLATLTTFKLTLNESEKESKNKLHLPYFDAQRMDVSEDAGTHGENNDDDDDDFYDEEDEEV